MEKELKIIFCCTGDDFRTTEENESGSVRKPVFKKERGSSQRTRQCKKNTKKAAVVHIDTVIHEEVARHRKNSRHIGEGIHWNGSS